MSALGSWWSSSPGKKMVMAITGLILFAYVFVHMLGNLQIFAPNGREMINQYAAFLHSDRAAPLLWGTRLVLLACVVLHLWSALVLTVRSFKARPKGYRVRRYREATYEARTMIWTGPIIAAFVVFHLLHLTVGNTGLPFVHLDAHANVVNGFRVPWVSVTYMVAVVMLLLHFRHGLWSWFQTVGWSHPAHDGLRRTLANLLTAIVVLGDLSIPISVLAGWVR